MKYRIGLIQAAKDMGASGTEVFDIKFKAPISRIEMTFKTTKVLSEMTAPGPANIPKLELVDGSTPLHSLTGYINQALAYYSRGNVSMEHGQHIATMSELDIYAIDFGRFLNDPLLAFDPRKFSNPQLKVQWNEALADTSVSVNSLEIWAHLFDEKQINPVGFLSAREIWSSAFGVANAYSEVAIPEGEIIRQILVRGYRDGYEPWYQVDQAKLDENVDERIPFDFTDLEMYSRRMKGTWPKIMTPFQAGVYTTARIFYIPQTDFWASLTGLPVASASAMYTDGASLKGGKASLISAADRQQIGMARGYLPWHTFQFPMGKLDDNTDWYDPNGKKPRLRLRASTSGASGTGTVAIETIHKY